MVSRANWGVLVISDEQKYLILKYDILSLFLKSLTTRRKNHTHLAGSFQHILQCMCDEQCLHEQVFIVFQFNILEVETLEQQELIWRNEKTFLSLKYFLFEERETHELLLTTERDMSVLCRNPYLFIYVKVSHVYQTRMFFFSRSFIGKQISLVSIQVFLTCYTRY